MLGSVSSTGVVVFSPHVDDEVLGCFAWLGSDTHVVWFGVDEFHEVAAEERMREAHAVANACGFTFTLCAGVVNHYQTRPVLEIAERMISELRPHTVLLPARSYNQDHRTVHDAAYTALRHHDRIPFVGRVLVYEQPHTLLWPTESFTPQLFVGIDLERKLETWRLHRSQNRAHRSADHIAQLASLRGRQADLPHAESFEVRRWVQ